MSPRSGVACRNVVRDDVLCRRAPGGQVLSWRERPRRDVLALLEEIVALIRFDPTLSPNKIVLAIGARRAEIFLSALLCRALAAEPARNPAGRPQRLLRPPARFPKPHANRSQAVPAGDV
jgi:hypothetical protein